MFYHNKFIFENRIPSEPGFMPTYCRSICISMTGGFLYLSVQLFLLLLRNYFQKPLKKGLMGLVYRIFVIMRYIIVSNLWIQHFSDDTNNTFLSVFKFQRAEIVTVYVIVKLVILFLLIKDLDKTRKKFLFYINHPDMEYGGNIHVESNISIVCILFCF